MLLWFENISWEEMIDYDNIFRFDALHGSAEKDYGNGYNLQLDSEQLRLVSNLEWSINTTSRPINFWPE